MTRYQVTLTLRPLTVIERLWYWHLGIPAPLSSSAPLKSEPWVRLLPQSWTRIHKRYARRHGFYWLP